MGDSYEDSFMNKGKKALMLAVSDPSLVKCSYEIGDNSNAHAHACPEYECKNFQALSALGQ